MLITPDLILYRKMYFQLFHDVTCALEALDLARNELKAATGAQKEQALEKAIEIALTELRKSQQKTEQIYMDG